MIVALLLLNYQKLQSSSAMVELLQLQCRTMIVILQLILYIFKKSIPDLVRFITRHETYFIHRKMRQGKRFDLKSFYHTSHLKIKQLCPVSTLYAELTVLCLEHLQDQGHAKVSLFIIYMKISSFKEYLPSFQRQP